MHICRNIQQKNITPNSDRTKTIITIFMQLYIKYLVKIFGYVSKISYFWYRIANNIYSNNLINGFSY